MPTTHLLGELRLPDRYEQLERVLGADLLRVLVDPPGPVTNDLGAIARAVRTKGRGLLVPIWADSGTGKSTLAHSVGHFLPNAYAPAVAHIGAIDDEALEATARAATRQQKAGDERVLPIVVDGREGEPPTEAELAAIKRFTRAPDTGTRCVLLWLETDEGRSRSMADDYARLAGTPPVELPLPAAGPPSDAWAGIAVETLRLANDVDSLQDLGVDPADYEPADYRTLGDFLSAIADDFNELVGQLLAELDKPTQLVVLFASESREPGPLAQFTEGRRLGLLNAHALVGATPNTEEGRWWGARLGALTSTIVRLNARAFVLPPTLSVTALRRHGDSDIRKLLGDASIRDVDPVPYWERSEVGRFLQGQERDAAEARGNPGEAKTDAYRVLVEAGHIRGGRDKRLNAGLGRSLETFLPSLEGYESMLVEKMMATAHEGGGEVIPDLRLEGPDLRTCLELAWRQGPYVIGTHRAGMAAYILRKLRAYARGLGWVTG